jgi:hypothetical protein
MIPHCIRLYLDDFKAKEIDRLEPDSPFRRNHEDQIEKLEAILADQGMGKALKAIDAATKSLQDMEQLAAGYGFCLLIKFRGGLLPKETPARRKKRRIELAEKIRELSSLIREEMRLAEGYQDNSLSCFMLSETVDRLSQIRRSIKKDPAPLIQRVSPHLPQRVTGGSPDNLFFCELVDWFMTWTGEENIRYVKDIFKACLRLDRDWAEEEEALFDIEDEDQEDDMRWDMEVLHEKEIERRTENARRHWYDKKHRR